MDCVASHVRRLRKAVIMTENQTERMVLAFEKMADALMGIKVEIRHIGLNDAATPMGALEALSCAIKDGLADVSSSLVSSSETIKDGFSLMSND